MSILTPVHDSTTKLKEKCAQAETLEDFFWKSLFFSASENQNFLIRLNDSRLQSVTVFAFFSDFSVYTEHIDLNLLFSQKIHSYEM